MHPFHYDYSVLRRLLRPRGPYPIWLTLASLAASGLLTWFVFAPELYILSVTTFRALFAWFTWYGTVFESAQEFLAHAPWVPVPYVWVVAALGLRRLAALALPSCNRPQEKPRQPLWSRIGKGLVALGLLPSALGLFVLLYVPAASHGWSYYFTTGGGLQRDRCSKCHSPYRPFHFIKSADLWRTTVNRMRRLEGAPIDDEQQAAIVSYLTAKAAYTDAWVFRAKCLGCHRQGTIQTRPRSAREWHLIIDRVSHVSPYAYRLDWKKQLKRHARSALADGGALSPRRQAKVTFEGVCGGCHSLRRAVRAGKDPGPIVDRMLRKVPARSSTADRVQILRYLEEPPKEGEEHESLFPHDGPLEVTW